MRPGAALALGVTILGCATLQAAEPPPERSAVLTTPHLTFFSDFETNLNDALIAAGTARKAGKPDALASCLGERPATERAGWDAAADYYAEVVSPADWTERGQYLIRLDLAGFDDGIGGDDDRRLVAIATGIRAAAAPGYAACLWRAQDAKNRRWIEALKPQLAKHEPALATRLQKLYGTTWRRLPIPIDVVENAGWSGANSSIDPPHLLIGSSNPDRAALEVVFHEASHVLMGRSDPLRQALGDAAATLGRTAPSDLWHVVLFYTTGEAVREVVPEYTPMLYEIFDRGTWTRYREPLETAWKPYVVGRTGLSEAAARLMAATQ